MSISKEWLDFLREQYPEGSRIKLRSAGDGAPEALKAGAMGTLERIGKDGNFHVAWDSGEKLPLIIGQDSFTVLPPPLQTLKLYMPMTASYWADDGCTEDEYTLDSREIAQYEPQITAALEKERRRLIDYGESHYPEAAERGLMAYYDGDNGVERKVQSLFFTAEVRDSQLWGVAECRIRGELTPEELALLKDEIEGQAADGAGESFEQREIRVKDGLEIYAHLWQANGWSIQTEQERFGPQEEPAQTEQGGINFA